MLSHETTVQPSRNSQQAADVSKTPDPEVVPKAERRRFSAEYKLRILAEADACTQRGEMTVTFTLTDADGGTDVLAVHDNLPTGLSPADNETGWQMALDKLAALVEAG